MQTKISQRRTRGQRIANQGGRSLGHQDLTSIGDRRDPSRAVHIKTNQASARLRRLTGVNADPHSHPVRLAPVMRSERSLHLYRRGGAGTGRAKDREERVSLRVDLPAAVGGELPANDLVMLRQELHVGVVTNALE